MCRPFFFQTLTSLLPFDLSSTPPSLSLLSIIPTLPSPFHPLLCHPHCSIFSNLFHFSPLQYFFLLLILSVVSSQDKLLIIICGAKYVVFIGVTDFLSKLIVRLMVRLGHNL